MKKIILTLVFLLTVTIAQAGIYKDALVITTLKLNAEGTALELDLPFRTYSQNIMLLEADVTYRLHDLSNVGKEVLAKISYRTIDHPSGSLKSLDESAVAEAFAGNMGNDWSKIKDKTKYKKHYKKKKKDKLAKYDEFGVKIPYNGADKNDITKFTEWEDDVANAEEGL